MFEDSDEETQPAPEGGDVAVATEGVADAEAAPERDGGAATVEPADPAAAAAAAPDADDFGSFGEPEPEPEPKPMASAADADADDFVFEEPAAVEPAVVAELESAAAAAPEEPLFELAESAPAAAEDMSLIAGAAASRRATGNCLMYTKCYA